MQIWWNAGSLCFNSSKKRNKKYTTQRNKNMYNAGTQLFNSMVHVKNVAALKMSGFYRLSHFLFVFVFGGSETLKRKHWNRVKIRLIRWRREKKGNNLTIITYVPSNAKCMSIQRHWLTVLYSGEMLPKRKIWHELNILPTIRHSNLLIHFIIFSRVYLNCVAFLLLLTYNSYVMRIGKEANSLGKYEIQNEVSWYSCVLCKWVRDGRAWLSLSWPLLLLFLLLLLLFLL